MFLYPHLRLEKLRIDLTMKPDIQYPYFTLSLLSNQLKSDLMKCNPGSQGPSIAVRAEPEPEPEPELPRT